MDNTVILDVIMVPSVLLFAGWMLYLLFRRYQVSMQVRLQKIETFNKLIEKFSGAKEFTEFVQTEEGKRILGDPVSLPSNPLAKVLRFLQAGILFVMVGIGSLINAARLHSETDPNYVHQMIEANHWGTLLIFLGVGLIVAAGVSYIFVRRWHLANGLLKK